jgi:mannose-6-phosphate isomerase
VYGHHAKTFEELCTLVNEKKWDKLLNFVNVQKGDVFYVPSGTLHALKKGLVILEIQQSSQSTFRLYDYERDQHERTLDVQQSIENTIVPFVKPQLEQLDSELLTTPFFSISEIHNQGTKTYDFSYAQWLQCFVVDGSGQIENIPLKKGTTFIIGNNDLNFQLTGNLHIILTYIRR